jgi:hypothetical protein
MNLPPVFQFQFVNNSGPLVGGMLYSYQAGTSIPQTTFVDSTGGTPNANPVVLDSLGSASIWLDPTVSYKFILTDSLGNTLWTKDNVVGTLSVNSVNTASIQNGAVTSIKIASGAITAGLIGAGAVTNSNIGSGQVTRNLINSTFGFLPPTVQTFTTVGTGTYNKSYIFFVSNANATVGATFTNNGVTFTVVQTISYGTILQCTASGAPSSSGVLSKSTGTGDTIINFTAFAAPLYLRARLVGAGAGGAGGGLNSSIGASGAGGPTTFGTSLLVANGGASGSANSGAGGTASLGTGPIGIALTGGSGNAGVAPAASSYSVGGQGSSSPFGGGGGGGSTSGNAASQNTGGGGGGGGGSPGVSNGQGGSGGAAGGYVEAIITNPLSSYPYSVGVAGTAGSPGSGGYAGAAGGSGIIIIEENYQ